MKEHLLELLANAIDALREDGAFSLESTPDIPLERGRDAAHGDYATPVALKLAKAARAKPRDIATAIVERLAASDQVARVEIAGPGFINFFLARGVAGDVVRRALSEGEAFGRSTVGAGQSIQVEFVSANPTGPLHVGHGRHAAYGASLANVLEAVGFDVQREYYVNDAGRQMDILGLSVWLRYLEAAGGTATVQAAFPSKAYRGEYVREIASDLRARHGTDFERDLGDTLNSLPGEADDAEARLSGFIAVARQTLGPEAFETVRYFSLSAMLEDIRDDLAGFRVKIDRYFSEGSLVEDGSLSAALDHLQQRGHLSERDGARWFASTHFGDDKDRVVVKENGETTYFASDIAYLRNKFARGFEHLIYVWGADHHGYRPRLWAAAQALGHDVDSVEIPLVQFAVLYRNGAKVQMSTRSGEFVCLRELREEVGNDAARFFYVMRKSDQHLDFDLDLAKSKSNENPVYYVQYAHARVCSVLRQAEERGIAFDPATVEPDLARLSEEHERGLLRELDRYPEVVQAAAVERQPHQIAFYLRALATELHTYYNAHQFLVDDVPTREARLALICAVRQVLANGLGLLDVSAPQSM